MICYTQVPGLSGGHQILALEQVSAIAVNEPLPEAADILLGLLGNTPLPRWTLSRCGGKQHAQHQDAAADSAADAAAAHPATHTSSQGHTLILGKAHILMEGGQDTLGTVAAVGMIVPSCLAFFYFIHSSFFASSLSFLIR